MRVVHVYPWGFCHPIRSGADIVAANQLAYFRKQGFEVHYVTGPGSYADRAAFLRDHDWIASVTTLPITLKGNLRHDLFQFVGACSDPGLRAVMARGINLFFTNYVFTAPLLDALPAGCRRVLETVDLLSDGWSVFEDGVDGDRNPGKIEATRRYIHNVELDLYRLFDRVIFLSHADYAAAQNGETKNACLVTPHVPNNPGSQHADLPGADLLFIGSAYPPNRDGIEWFYRTVFVPHLRGSGITLTIVGGVCRQIDVGDDPQVRLIPFVEGSLAAAYAQAKLAIAPIFEGSGVAIKTIEALGFGAVVYTTPVGARGLPDVGDAMVVDPMKPDPAATGAAIRALLANEAHRTRLSQAARRAHAIHFSREVYEARLAEVLEPDGSRIRRR